MLIQNGQLSRISVFLLLVSMFTSAGADGGLRFSTARIIYQQSDKGGSYTELENDSGTPCLIQSWITPVDTGTGLPVIDRPVHGEVPFMITPPLIRLAPGERYRWRIQRVNDGQLPTDRESVFYVALKVIPATDNKVEAAGEFVLSPVMYLKMLYRPQALDGINTDGTAGQMHFERRGDILIARNPTPLSVTFASLQAGSHMVPDEELSKIVPPFGEQYYTLPRNINGDVIWRTLNEYGLATKAGQTAVPTGELLQ